MILIGMCAVWGFHFVVIKLAVAQAPPIFYAAIRMTLVAALMSPFLRWRRGAMLRAFLDFLRLPHDQGVLRNADRKAAIQTACQLAGPEDIVLVAGKGHETYQEIKGVRHPFDDREILKETFKTLEH